MTERFTRWLRQFEDVPLWSFFVFAGCILWVGLDRFWLESVDPPFGWRVWPNVLADISYRVCTGFIGSFIFFLLLTRENREREKRLQNEQRLEEIQKRKEMEERVKQENLYITKRHFEDIFRAAEFVLDEMAATVNAVHPCRAESWMAVPHLYFENIVHAWFAGYRNLAKEHGADDVYERVVQSLRFLRNAILDEADYLLARDNNLIEDNRKLVQNLRRAANSDWGIDDLEPNKRMIIDERFKAMDKTVANVLNDMMWLWRWVYKEEAASRMQACTIHFTELIKDYPGHGRLVPRDKERGLWSRIYLSSTQQP